VDAPVRLIVYTAIFGEGRDELQPAPPASPGVEYHAYGDFLKPVDGWKIHPLKPARDPRRAARTIKILGPLYGDSPPAEWTLWLDGSLALLQSPVTIVQDFARPDFRLAVFKHGERDCVYQEASACCRLRKDDRRVILDQTARYRAEWYPEHRGLAETGMLLRRRSPETEEHADLWWSEVWRGSVRDQLSFDYACWKLGLTYDCFPGRVRWNECPYVRFVEHKDKTLLSRENR